jgi:putative tricarboxylic transport membrane protein
MKRRNLITAILLLALSVGILAETSTLPIGTLRSPQAGFFPLILSVLLGLLSLILLIQILKGRVREKMAGWVSSGGWKPLGLTTAGLFAFGVFFEKLGYLVSTFLLIAFLVGVVGKNKWVVAILFAFLSALVSYLLFGVMLKTQLPTGILRGILPD